jgi:hypothetical protein
MGCLEPGEDETVRKGAPCLVDSYFEEGLNKIAAENNPKDDRIAAEELLDCAPACWARGR